MDSLHNPDFYIPTIEQVKDRLSQAGFTNISDPHSLESGMVVLQAYK